MYILGTMFALWLIFVYVMRRLKAIFGSVFRAMKDWVVTLVTAKKHKSCSMRIRTCAHVRVMWVRIWFCV